MPLLLTEKSLLHHHLPSRQCFTIYTDVKALLIDKALWDTKSCVLCSNYMKHDKECLLTVAQNWFSKDAWLNAKDKKYQTMGMIIEVKLNKRIGIYWLQSTI